MVLQCFVCGLFYVCILVTLVQSKSRSLQTEFDPSKLERTLFSNTPRVHNDNNLLSSHRSSTNGLVRDLGHNSIGTSKTTRTTEPQTLLTKSSESLDGWHTESESIQYHFSQLERILKSSNTAASSTSTLPKQIQEPQPSLLPYAFGVETSQPLPRLSSPSSSIQPTQLVVGQTVAPSSTSGSSVVSSPWTSSVSPSVSASAGVTPIAIDPRATPSLSPSQSPEFTTSASPSFTKTVGSSVSASSQPSSTAFAPATTKSSASASQEIHASPSPSALPRMSPEVLPTPEETGADETLSNQTVMELSIGDTITVRDFKYGSLLNRTGKRDSDGQFSDVLIILSLNSSTQEEMTTLARQDSLDVSPSVVTVRACVETSTGTEDQVTFLFLHAFRRATLSETDLMVSRGFTRPFRYNETYTCTVGVAIDVPSDTTGPVHLVLSKRVSVESAVVKVSAVRSSNTVAESPLNWNINLLSMHEKLNKSFDTIEQPFVFVISSWPYLKHVELDGIQVDNSGFRFIYGSESRFPNPVCDDSGTQLVTSIVGRRLGVGPNQTRIVPIPVRDCEKPYTLDFILSALRHVNTNVETSSSSNSFLLFDDQLEESGLLNDSTLQKEFQVLANAGVITLIPGKTCIASQPSYVAVGAFGRAAHNRTYSSTDNEYVIRSSMCSDMFDVFGPGDFSTTASLAGQESYENIDRGSNVAAGGVLSVFLLLSLNWSRKINVTEAKSLLRGLTKTTPLVGDAATGELSGYGRALPLLGSGTSLSDLRKSFADLSSSSSTNNFMSFVSSLPTAAVVGICLAIGLVLMVVVVGCIIIACRRRGRADEEEEEGESASRDDIENVAEQHTHMPRDRSRGALLRPPTILDIQSPVPIKTQSDRREKDKSRPVQPQPIRVPVVQRLLSLNRAKESPITRGDKASWFATPKSEKPDSPTFNR